MKIHRVLLLLSLLLIAFTASAKDFSFTDTKGNPQNLVDYRGQWVLVNFWATWCPPCRQETPDLVALHNEHKLAVIGVALDSQRPAVKAFMTKYAVTYPIVIGSYTMAEYQVGKVEALPTSYLYDPTGQLVSFQEGMLTRQEIETYIMLKQKQNAKSK